MPSARRKPDKESLAGTAGERVRAIIEAAEASAAEIRAEAEAEAERVRASARREAEELLERVRRGVERLAHEVGVPAAAPERVEAVASRREVDVSPAPAPAPVAEPEPDPDIALAEDAAVGLDDPKPEPEPAGDHEGARLVALNMALDGASRDDVEQRLRESHGVSDPAPLIDEVFASLGR
jgi:hypothetical protein